MTKEAARVSRPQDLEICICAAIVAENGEVIRGHRHMDCLRTAGERGLKQKPGGEHQGFVTSRNRYVDRRIAAALQKAAGIESADTEHPYLNDECYSEDLYAAVPVSPAGPPDEKAWVIERHIHSQLHYWSGRPGHWSTQHQDAVRFARRTDAELMLTYHHEGNGNVVEHLWTK